MKLQNKICFAGTLILDLLASKIVKNKFVLFKASICGVWLWQQEQTNTVVLNVFYREKGDSWAFRKFDMNVYDIYLKI